MIRQARNGPKKVTNNLIINAYYTVIFIYMTLSYYEHSFILPSDPMNVRNNELMKKPKQFEDLEDIFPRKSIIRTIETLLKDKCAIVLRGESGIGKSFIAKQFQKKSIKDGTFKRILFVNVSDNNIQKSMDHMAQEMGLDILDESSSPLIFDKLYKKLMEKISNENAEKATLIIFEDAEVKFFMKCYEQFENIKMIISTQCGEDYLTDVEESGIIHLQPYNHTEISKIIEDFEDLHQFNIQDQSLCNYFSDNLRGFPLAIYQVLNEINFQLTKANMKVDMPLNKIVMKCINIESTIHTIKEMDDPHIQIVGITIKSSFERLIKLQEDVGRKAKELFHIMSYMDHNYLFKELFMASDGEDKKNNYENALKVLEDMKLLKYEER